MNIFNYVSQLTKLILGGAVIVTKYVNKDCVVRMRRKLYRGAISKREPMEIIMKIGKPNYKERLFIKDCIKSGERFPVKKIQIKYLKVKGEKI